MMKPVRLLLLLSLLVPATSVLAQSGEIAGIVTHAPTGESLPGAFVVIEGTTQGAVTDVDGFYNILNVSPGIYDVRASFYGLTAEVVQGVRVNTDLTTEVDFALREEVVGLDELVTTYNPRHVEGSSEPAIDEDPPSTSRNVKPVGPAAGLPDLEMATYHALLIAVEDYPDPRVKSLDYPIQDAENLRKVLLERYTFEGENVHLLRNPSRDEILDTLGALRRQLTPDDNLLIFFAGHGWWDEGVHQGYWLPKDARRASQSNWISNSDIRDQIRGIPTQHTLLISDACFSGGIFKEREPFTRDPLIGKQRLYGLPSRRAMTSGVLEAVPDRSVFAEYLVKRLTENTDRYLDAGQLFGRLREPVQNNSPTVPQYGVIFQTGDEGGDFVFARSGTSE